MSYMVDKPPNQDKVLEAGVRHFEPKTHKPNMTATRSAFKTYSTYVDVPWRDQCEGG